MLSINTSTCRLCLTNESVTVDIFNGHDHSLFKKIQICLPIMVKENDRLPRCICETCFNKVNFFYEFYNQTLQAEQHFMSLLSTSNEILPENLYSYNQRGDEVGVENLRNGDVLCELALSNDQTGQKMNYLSQSLQKEYHNNEDFNHGLLRSLCRNDNNESKDDIQLNENVIRFSSREDSQSVSTELEDENQLPNETHKTANVEKNANYSCDKCHFTTHSKPSFAMHSKRHVRKYNVFCPECNISFLNKADMTLHNIEQHDAQPFQCAHCNDVFTSKNTLYSHIKSHDPSSVHICEICGKTYKKKNSYKRHINRNHLGMSAKAQCAICDRILSSKEHLRRHMLVHTDERNWVCATCGKCYRSKCYLTEHSRIHAGIKPHKCEICGKCFTQRGSLTIHKRSHTGERPFRCEYCDRGFIISTLLRYHMKKCSSAPTLLVTDHNFKSEPISVITTNSSVRIEQ